MVRNADSSHTIPMLKGAWGGPFAQNDRAREQFRRADCLSWRKSIFAEERYTRLSRPVVGPAVRLGSSRRTWVHCFRLTCVSQSQLFSGTWVTKSAYTGLKECFAELLIDSPDSWSVSHFLNERGPSSCSGSTRSMRCVLQRFASSP